jgi:hypothetical protein
MYRVRQHDWRNLSSTPSSPSRFRLESPQLWRVEHNTGEINRPTPLTFFSSCAVVDFVFGVVKWRSVVAGIVAIVCGVALTGLLFLGASGRGRATTTPVRPAPRDKADDDWLNTAMTLTGS